MSSNALALTGGGMPAAFRGKVVDMNAAANEGITLGFAVIGYKGKVWTIKHRGETTPITHKDAKGRSLPAQALEVVVVGVSPHVSKQYYAKTWVEGDDAAPDCFSLDGIKPDVSVAKKQCDNCAACPMNVFGSKITDQGKKAKQCVDSRRLAVVPRGDIENESYGGPMLLRLPTMSVGAFARYTNDLSRYSAQPYMVGTSMTFDVETPYPLISFEAEGWLAEEEADLIAKVMESPQIDRMLNLAEVTQPPSEPANGPASKLGTPRATPAETVSASEQASAVEEDEEAKLLAEMEAQQAAARAKLEAARAKKAQEAAAAKAAAEREAARLEAERRAAEEAAKQDALQPQQDDEEAALEAEMKRIEEEAAAALAAARAKAAAKNNTTLPADKPKVTAPPKKDAKPDLRVVEEPTAAPGEDDTPTADTTLKEAPADMMSMIDNLLA